MKQKTGRKLLGVLLTLALVLGLMPGMSLTALAEGTTYNPASAYTDYAALNSSNTVVTIEEVANVEWYVIGYDSEAKTVTLFSKTSFGNKAFNSDNSKGHSYANSEIKTFVEGLTDDGQPLAEIKDALANISVTGNPSISGSVPYLLSTAEADKLDGTKKGSDAWWLRSPGYNDDSATFVYGGDVDDEYGALVDLKLAVRPALQLNLESVIFDSESKTFSLKPVSKDPVSYMAWDEIEKKLVEKTGNDACTDYTVVTNSTTTFEDGKWYVVNSNVTIDNKVTCNGDVHLILVDGAALTVSKGISVAATNCSLTIYGQSEGTGTLTATGSTYAAGIGGGAGAGGGTITINGGKVTATGATYAAGIGGGVNGGGGTITINGGTVTATGGAQAAGIGGGKSGSGGAITINGGEVVTAGCLIDGANDYAGAGIGNGADSSGGTITINGGSVEATGGVNSDNAGNNGKGIDGTLTLGAGMYLYGGDSESPENDLNNYRAGEGSYTDDRYLYMTVNSVAPKSEQTHTHDGISFTAWTSTDSLPTTTGSYYLTNDVTLSKTWEVDEKNITLCLNGHGIIIVNSSDSPIGVRPRSNLILMDDDGAGSTHYYYIDEGGRGHIVDQENDNYKNASDDRKGSFTGGYITVADNCTGYSNGIVEIMNYASFTMNGGTIIGGTERGVEINSSSFTMSAGNIIGNRGGGVHVSYSSSVFNMEGGVISYNNEYGVGLYGCGSFNVSGNPTITKNKNSKGACNVLVISDSKLTIGGALTNTTPIGVTMDQPGVFTSSPNTEKAKDYAAKFKSDSDSYTVKVDGNELKLDLSQEHDKENAVAATVTANNRTYDGTDKPLVTADNSTLVGGTMQYAIGTSATTAPTSGWSTSIPTATNVGTYYVWYKVVGDENHADTKPVMLKAVIENVDQGEAEIKTEVRTDENSPEVKPSNLTKEFAESTLSSEEKAVIEDAINNGEDVKVDVYLAIKDISDTISVSDQEKVKAAATDADKIEFFDISLFKEISISGQSRGATPINNLTTPLKLTIGVPKSFPTLADGYTRTYVVLRLHEGSVTVLPTTLNADGTLSFETDKFSTYALAYTDTKEPASTSDATTAEAAKTSPKTGDSMPIAVLVVLMFAAAGMLVFMDLKKKKN